MPFHAWTTFPGVRFDSLLVRCPRCQQLSFIGGKYTHDSLSTYPAKQLISLVCTECRYWMEADLDRCHF
jgi:hypothetical protein